MPHMLARAGMENCLGELLDIAVRVAQETRDASGRAVRIAGGLPPLDQSYRPDLVGPDEVVEAVHREIAGHMAPGVDLLVCETMSSAAEARGWRAMDADIIGGCGGIGPAHIREFGRVLA